MSESRTLSYPVALTTAQLSVLLTIVQAKQLFGANNQQLFPEEADKREELWQTGQHQLTQDNWLLKEGGASNLNERLLLLVATMAAANTIVLSQVAAPEQPAQAVTHYVSDTSVIEMTYRDDIYQLTALESLAVMTNRLAFTFALPSAKQEDITFEMTQDQIQRIQLALDTSDTAIPSYANPLYVNVLRHLRHKGKVQLVQIGLDRIIARQQLGVLVSSDNIALMAVSQQQKTLYRLTNINTFQQTLAETVAQLRGEIHV